MRIKNEELVRELVGEIKDFPRYTTQLLNLANQNAQGTRPRVVGRLWVEDLVLEKTFIGLRFQEAILKKVAETRGMPYRLASVTEEAQGIDGVIGDVPISIKPSTYKIKNALRETLKAKIIFYDKTKSGLEIDDSQL